MLKKKNTLETIIQKLKDYRSNKKYLLDSLYEPAIFLGAANIAYLTGASEILDYVSEHTNNGVSMLATYGALLYGAYAANFDILHPLRLIKKFSSLPKYGFKRVANYIYEHNRLSYRKGKEQTILGWLKTLAATAGLAALIFSHPFKKAISDYKSDASRIIDSFSRPKIEATLNPPDRVLPDAPLQGEKCPGFESNCEKSCDTGAIYGKKISNLYCYYTGLNEGIVNEKYVSIDFKKQMKILWDMKNKFNNPEIDKYFNESVSLYLDPNFKPTRMTLDDYIEEADRVISEIRENIDWNYIAEIKGLSQKRINLLKKIADDINGNDLVSYAMTELMPSADGYLNKAVMDFILRNGGREYLEMIPALYDGYLSFGPYQFTSFALNDKTRDGASLINQALPNELKIPGSVSKLKGNDHHKAAYLLAIKNLATLIDGLSDEQFKALDKYYSPSRKLNIVQFIATSHHRPRGAIKAAESWIDKKMKKNFAVYCDINLRKYAKKTEANLKALYSTRFAEISQEPKEFIADNSEGSFNFIREDSKGNHVFEYIVQAGNTLYGIAREFNNWDKNNGDNYNHVHYTSILFDSPNQKVLMPGKKAYILAKRIFKPGR